MKKVALTRLGSLVIINYDNPCDAEIRRRLQILLMAPLPQKGTIGVWPGRRRDEVCWQKVG